MKSPWRHCPDPLPAPVLPAGLPLSAQWLAGEGAGSWFVIASAGQQKWWVSRYSPEGRLECEGSFKSDDVFDMTLEFEIGFPSHCAELTLWQQGQRIVLKRLSD